MTDAKRSPRDIVLAFYAAALNEKNVEKAKEFLGETYIQHNPRVLDGPEALLRFVAKENLGLFPGLIAAAVVVEAGGDYRHQRLQAYRDRLSARFGPETAPAVGNVPGFLRNILARALLGNRWATRRVVLDRWFLRAHQPALQ